jgi:hypothetical protein
VCHMLGYSRRPEQHQKSQILNEPNSIPASREFTVCLFGVR